MAQTNSWNMRVAQSGWEALERVQTGEHPSLVLLDLGQQDADGLHTLRWLRRVRPEAPILVLTDFNDVQHKTEAIRLGAQEYLVRPLQESQIEAAIERHLVLENGDGDFETELQEVEEIGENRFFIASSLVMRRLRAQAGLLAQIDVPLLIMGEKGSGKETAARLIHKLSLRSGFRFLKVTCAALSGDLLENKLFGADHGQPANGHRARAGKFEPCEQGTVLLDEITELPLDLQAKLFRLLEEKQSGESNGGSAANVQARIIVSTSANAEQAIAHGTLRQDLYYRLSFFPVHIPALRYRASEIPLFLGHLMSQLARHYGLETRSFSPELLQACQRYPWPGNLTQLESFVKRYLVTHDEEAALGELQNQTENTLGSSENERQGSEDSSGFRPGQQLSGLKFLVQSVKGEAERNAILAALEQTHWNRRAAARILKVSYRTLLYKIQQYNMTPAAYLSQFGATFE